MCEVNDFMFMFFYSGMNDDCMKPLIFVNHDFIGFILNIELREDINFDLTEMRVRVTILKDLLELNMTWFVLIGTALGREVVCFHYDNGIILK